MQRSSAPAALAHEAVRGVLIFLVILDHNDLVRGIPEVDAWFKPLTFHVAGFLFLPFLAPSKGFTVKFVQDRAVRYLTPYVFTLAAYCLAYFVMVAAHGSVGEAIAKFAVAAAIGSAETSKQACGFVALWFLPAFLATVLLREWIDSVPPRLRWLLIIGAITLHCTTGDLPSEIKTWTPQGILIAVYILPLGIALPRLLSLPAIGRWPLTLLCSSGAILALSWTYLNGIEVEIGTLQLPSIMQPLAIIATDASDLSGFVFLLCVGRHLTRIPGLNLLGRYSLIVYLAHPLLYKLLFLALQPVADPTLPVAYWAFASLSVLLVTVASLIAAVTVSSYAPARQLLTPRDLQGWLPVTAWRRVSLGT